MEYWIGKLFKHYSSSVYCVFICKLQIKNDIPDFFCISDKPICHPEQKRIYGVARNEAVDISCKVDAFPPPESFKWSFNNTAETFDMPQSGYRIQSAQESTLTYTPVKVCTDVYFFLFQLE
jgi:hypothetical protein